MEKPQFCAFERTMRKIFDFLAEKINKKSIKSISSINLICSLLTKIELF